MRRLVLIALFLTSPLFAQEPATLRIESKVLGETRTVLVRTPPSYDAGNRTYPVVYMTDGDRQLGHTVATADYLAREGRMPEVILVGITNTDRIRDLTPTRVESVVQNGQTLRFPTSGGAEKFLAFIATEVIPQIEKSYRTMPYRVFAGHSFGGLFALYAFFQRPDLFQGIIAASPALIWDDRYPVRRANDLVKSGRTLNHTVVITEGNEGEEFDREFRALEALFKQLAPKGLVLETHRFMDEDHGSVVMPTHYAGLRRVFAPWRFTVDGDVRTLHARARTHYEQLSKRVGVTMPIPEPTGNMIAYRLMQAGHLPEAIEALKANADAYPESPNVYDSLGEAYEKQGDSARARENYARAVELGRKVADPNLSIYEQNLQRVSSGASRGAAIAAKVAELGGTVVMEGQSVVRIDLHGTKVSDADLEFLREARDLRELDLRLTPVSDGVTEHIRGLRKLEFLNLFRTGLTDAGLQRLAPLTELRTLLIGGTGVTDRGVATLTTLQHLRKLSLFRTAVSNDALTSLRQLPALEVLLIGGSQITEERAREAMPSVRFSEKT